MPKRLNARPGRTCQCEPKNVWLPTPVDALSEFLSVAIPTDDKDNDSYINKKNVAYALQYSQFLRQTICEGLPTTVLYTQQVKAYNLNVVAVVEATLEYGLRAKLAFGPGRLVASQISKEWRKRSGCQIDDLLTAYDNNIAVRNRIHLAKHQDNPTEPFRDTSYNFFQKYGFKPTDELLAVFLACRLFNGAKNREAIIRSLLLEPNIRHGVSLDPK